VTFRVAPIDHREANEMLARSVPSDYCAGCAEKSRRLAAITDTVLRISQLVTEFPEIVELDINPLMVFEAGKGAWPWTCGWRSKTSSLSIESGVNSHEKLVRYLG